MVLRGPAVLVSDGVLRPEWLRLVAGPPGADAAATDPAGTDAAGREAAGTEAAPSAAGRAAAGV
ncbi:hypothetical protein MXD63_00385 [Frankia sp. Cpl3]|nr:hypothetical protein [Frankia sp. Cpl3]